MYIILLGIASAGFFGGHAILVRFGLQESNPMSATLVSSLVNCLFLWVLTLFLVPVAAVDGEALKYLVVAGIIAPCLARIFMYTAFQKVGVSIATPIRSTFPFFSILPAVFVLNEQFTVSVAIATLLTAAGVVLLSLSSTEKVRLPTQLRWRRKDLLYPLAGAACYGISNFFKKLGIARMDSPLLGAAIVATASLAFLLLLWPITSGRRGLRLGKRSLAFTSLGGISAGVAQICMYTALKAGDLIIVGPLVSTTPLFTLVLTYVFLRKSEKLTIRVVGGAVAIVAGVVVLKVLP
ncbi:MAG: EamA family transporter [Deferrisomatales bacterium]|nr:EamA family transporter [Deferrisomatales bacterium]